MKALVIVLSLISLPAFGHTFDFGKVAPMLSKFKVSTDKTILTNARTPLSPIRIGHVKVAIHKITQVIDRNGNIHVSASEVCLKEGDAPVYDVRGLNEYTIQNSPIECDSTVDNKPVKVVFSAGIYIFNSRLFKDENAADLKYAGAGLWVSEVATNNAIAWDTFMSGSRDLNNSSYIGGVGESPSLSCIQDANGNMTCNASTVERFQASLEITDK